MFAQEHEEGASSGSSSAAKMKIDGMRRPLSQTEQVACPV